MSISATLCGEHHDGRPRIDPADLATHVDAVDVGKTEVQQHQVVGPAVRLAEGVGPGADPVDPVALILENLPEAVTDRGIVLHDHDAG